MAPGGDASPGGDVSPGRDAAPDLDAGSDQSADGRADGLPPCLESRGDVDAGTIGCGPITCDVRTTPVCVYDVLHDGSCYSSTRCVALPAECAASPSCACLMQLPSDAGPVEGGVPGEPTSGFDRFCGTSRTSNRGCFDEPAGGFRVTCSPI